MPPNRKYLQGILSVRQKVSGPLRRVQQSFESTGEAIEDVTSETAGFAAVTDEAESDTESFGRAITSMLDQLVTVASAMERVSSETDEAGDEMTESAGEIQPLIVALGELIAVGETAQHSIDDLNNEDIDIDATSLDQIRGVMGRVIDDADSLQTALDSDTTVEADLDVDQFTEAANAVNELFEHSGFDSDISTDVTDSTEALRNATEALGDHGVTARASARESDSFGSAITNVQNELLATGETIRYLSSGSDEAGDEMEASAISAQTLAAALSELAVVATAADGALDSLDDDELNIESSDLVNVRKGMHELIDIADELRLDLNDDDTITGGEQAVGQVNEVTRAVRLLSQAGGFSGYDIDSEIGEGAESSADSVRTLNEQINRVRGSVADVDWSRSNVRGDVSSSGVAVDSLRSQITSVSESIGSIDWSDTGLGDQTSETDQSLTGVVQTLALVSRRLDALSDGGSVDIDDSEVTALTSRLETALSTLDRVDDTEITTDADITSVDELRQRVRILRGSIQQVDETGISVDTDDSESSARSLRSVIDSVANKVGEVSQSSIEIDADDSIRSAGEVRDQIEGIISVIDSVDWSESIDSINWSDAELDEDISETDRSLIGVIQTLATVSRRLDDLSDGGSVDIDDSEVTALTSSLETALSTLDRVDESEIATDADGTSVDELRQRISTLRGSIRQVDREGISIDTDGSKSSARSLQSIIDSIGNQVGQVSQSSIDIDADGSMRSAGEVRDQIEGIISVIDRVDWSESSIGEIEETQTDVEELRRYLLDVDSALDDVDDDRSVRLSLGSLSNAQRYLEEIDAELSDIDGSETSIVSGSDSVSDLRDDISEVRSTLNADMDSEIEDVGRRSTPIYGRLGSVIDDVYDSVSNIDASNVGSLGDEADDSERSIRGLRSQLRGVIGQRQGLNRIAASIGSIRQEASVPGQSLPGLDTLVGGGRPSKAQQQFTDSVTQMMSAGRNITTTRNERPQEFVTGMREAAYVTRSLIAEMEDIESVDQYLGESDSLSDLGRLMRRSGQSVDDLSGSFTNLSDNQIETLDAMVRGNRTLSDFTERLSKANDETSDVGTRLSRMSGHQQLVTEQAYEGADSFGEFVNELSAVGERTEAVGKEIGSLNNRQTEIVAGAYEGSDSFSEFASSIEESNETIRVHSDRVVEIADQESHLSDVFKSTSGSIEDYSDRLEEANERSLTARIRNGELLNVMQRLSNARVNFGPFNTQLGTLVTVLPIVIGLIGSLVGALGGITVAAAGAGGALAAMFAGGLLARGEQIAQSSEDIETAWEGVQEIFSRVASAYGDALQPLQTPLYENWAIGILEGSVQLVRDFALFAERLSGPMMTIFDAMASDYWQLEPVFWYELEKTVRQLAPLLRDMFSYTLNAIIDFIRFSREMALGMDEDLGEAVAAFLEFASAASEAGQTVFQVVLPPLTRLIEISTYLLERLNSLPQPIRTAVVAFALLVPTVLGVIATIANLIGNIRLIGSVLDKLGILKYVKKIGKIGSAFKKVGGIVKKGFGIVKRIGLIARVIGSLASLVGGGGIGLSALFGPPGVLIAGLIAALVVLQSKFDILGKSINFLKGIFSGLLNLVEIFANALLYVGGLISGYLVEGVQTAKEEFLKLQIVQDIIGGLTWLFEGLVYVIDQVVSALTDVYNWVAGIFNEIGKILGLASEETQKRAEETTGMSVDLTGDGEGGSGGGNGGQGGSGGSGGAARNGGFRAPGGQGQANGPGDYTMNDNRTVNLDLAGESDSARMERIVEDALDRSERRRSAR